MLDELKFEQCTHSHDPMVGCALEGVANIIAGVREISIVLHSPQGCTSTVVMGYDNHECDFTQRKVACTRLFETDIILGATDKLRDLILKADAAYKTKVMFVVGTCSADIIGEDLEGLCRLLQPKVQARLIPIHSGGFRGNYYAGIDMGLQMLLQFVQKHAGPRLDRSVNLILPQAGLNPTWWADLDWVKGVLAAMGVTTQCVFPYASTLEDLALASAATVNIALSHDAGFGFLGRMESAHGVPTILKDLPLPVGLKNTANWLRALGEYFNAREIAEELIADGETKVTETLRRRGLMMIPRYRNAHVAIAADATMAIAFTRLLFEDLEMIPDLLLVRSDSPQARKLLDLELGRLGIAPRVAFGVDGYQVKQALQQKDLDAVFGSAWEKYIAEEIGIRCAFDVVQPTNRTCYRDGAYLGYDGMLNLLEVVANDWEAAFRSKAIRWEQFQ